MAIIYINKDEKKITLPSHQNLVVLSPSFYWYKSLDLKLSNRKVKKLLPSLISDKPAEFDANYFYKKADGYAIYAYKSELVLRLKNELEGFGFTFAQELFSNIQRPLKISDDTYIANINGIVFEVKKEFLGDLKFDEVNTIHKELSKNQLFIAPKKELANTSRAWQILIAASIAIMLIDISQKIAAANKISLQNEAFNTQDRVTTEALYEKYKKLEEQEQLKRQKIAEAIAKNPKEIILNKTELEIR